MTGLNIWQNTRILRLGLAPVLGLAMLLGLLSVLGDAQPVGSSGSTLPTLARAVQNDLPDEFPIVTHPAAQQWLGISGDCVVYRDDRDGTWDIFIYKLSTGETFTVTTDEPADLRKVAISQGVVVWRSERADARGLWGYYNPYCSDAGPFTITQIISPFYIVSRAMTHAPAVSGEMVTFDTWAPKGWWHIELVELDANDNGVPDATEDGYDPSDANHLIPISSPFWQGERGQRLSDITYDDDYKIACWYDNGTGVERIECNDLQHLNDPNPWTYRFAVATSTWIPLVDFRGVLAVHRDLVVWTDGRDHNLSGFDLYIADLDPDDDGDLDTEDPAVYVLVNYPWDQEYPDIWWPFVVWQDKRNGNPNNPDIYAYDLSLDLDGDGVPNWKDPDRPCVDQAEFPVTLDPAAQTTPEIWTDTVVWPDNRNGNPDIYGAHLDPVVPQPRVPVTGTSQEKALHWLDKQTVHLSQVQDIPGYIDATGLITRYKSFSQNGEAWVRRAWYSSTVGSYVVSYDFCYYGTPDQKRYLGRFGRGFTYDQGLALIARSMFTQPAQAQELGSYVSSFQNQGQVSTAISGSFGFSFNGQGYWGEKDNFYDMDYLRTGANAWLGYGYLFYNQLNAAGQFTPVITRVADYILDQQVLTPTDGRYGLFTGGFGNWITQTDEFTDAEIEWVATEHNIDVYFLLRDLGLLLDESRYTDAAELLRANMPQLWDETKGRLHQGMVDENGTLNRNDALDAASWGAMYWTAVGDLEKAKRSLAFADHAYRNWVTTTISASWGMSAEISIWGYKPYTGTAEGSDWSTVDVVWSEGSLGVAMASLKLGHALLECGDAEGEAYIQKAREIVAEMEKLQALDPDGGLLYGISDRSDVSDFSSAPSAAGTAWLLMVQRALEDQRMRDAFWGRDQGIIHCVTISGPPAGSRNYDYVFTATVSPISVTLPVTYVWQATDQAYMTQTGGLSDAVTFSWDTSGPKRLIVTAQNIRNGVTGTHTFSIFYMNYLPIALKSARGE